MKICGNPGGRTAGVPPPVDPADTVKVRPADAVADRESVTVTVNGYPPGDAPVVPDRTPAEERVIPLGRPAVAAQVNGPVPPDSVRVWVKGTPTDAGFSDVVVTEIPGTRIDRDPELPTVDPASVAFTVNVLVPATVGVPEITPALDRDSPVGREPVRMAHVYGDVPPCTCSVCE